MLFAALTELRLTSLLEKSLDSVHVTLLSFGNLTLLSHRGDDLDMTELS